MIHPSIRRKEMPRNHGNARSHRPHSFAGRRPQSLGTQGRRRHPAGPQRGNWHEHSHSGTGCHGERTHGQPLLSQFRNQRLSGLQDPAGPESGRRHALRQPQRGERRRCGSLYRQDHRRDHRRTGRGSPRDRPEADRARRRSSFPGPPDQLLRPRRFGAGSLRCAEQVLPLQPAGGRLQRRTDAAHDRGSIPYRRRHRRDLLYRPHP